MDHRTDIYSLGATLYELLTLRPEFPGDDRHELLRQIAFEEPIAPRKWNRAIPAELEIIVLKAMEKNPADRYTSALELADDLRRHLRDEPIRAKRPSLVQRVRKWSRRHPALVGSAAVCSLVALLTLSGAIGWVASERSTRGDRVRRDVTALLDDVESRRAVIHEKLADPIKVCELMSDIDGWREAVAKARATWKHADNLAASNQDVASRELGDRLQQADGHLRSDEEDWNLAKKLDDIRLEAAILVDGKWNPRACDPKYKLFFADLGLDIEKATPAEIATKFKQEKLRYVLVAALDHWYSETANTELLRPKMLEAARLADPDPWRDQVREPHKWSNEHGEALVQDVVNARRSPHVIHMLARRLRANPAAASSVLRLGVLHHPRDFWLHFDLGNLLRNPDQRIGCFQVALAIRPDSVAAHNNIGMRLNDKKDFDAAIQHFGKALELDPKFVFAHNGLGNALLGKKDLDAAIEHYRKALELDPNYAFAYCNLGNALRDKKDLDAAIQHYRKALELDPKFAGAHYALQETGASRPPLGIACEVVDECIRVDKEIGRRDEIVELHGDSMMPNSSSSASRRSVSQSPCQRSIPADSRAMFGLACTDT